MNYCWKAKVTFPFFFFLQVVNTTLLSHDPHEVVSVRERGETMFLTGRCTCNLSTGSAMLSIALGACICNTCLASCLHLVPVWVPWALHCAFIRDVSSSTAFLNSLVAAPVCSTNIPAPILQLSNYLPVHFGACKSPRRIESTSVFSSL